MSKLVLDLDLGYCESCGNWVTVVEVDGDYLCQSEYLAYPDLATVIR